MTHDMYNTAINLGALTAFAAYIVFVYYAVTYPANYLRRKR